MRSLYFKIFLWFWLSIAVLSATLVVLAALPRSRTAEDERWRGRNRITVDLRAHRVVDYFDQQGASTVEGFLAPLEQRDPIRNYLFDSTGDEVLGRQAPPQALKTVALMRDVVAEPGVHFFTEERTAAERTPGIEGHAYIFVMTFPPQPLIPASLLRFLLEDVGPDAIIRLASVLVLAGFFCFWLARHITRPIDQLREAAREIASEHLEARVDQQVTGRKDELAELGRGFNRMAERIDELVSAQRRLLANVSHELRSPLSRLNVSLALARKGATPESFKHLDRIEREADRLNHLIGQLLTLTRVESGVDARHKELFDLCALLQEVAADGDFEAQSRRCHVRFSSLSPCFVEGSPELLRGAVENVIRNAVRYTAEGTNVEVSIESRATRAGYQVIVMVRDHGPGVPTGELSNIFLPFYRVDGGGHTSNSAGLGLAIVERAMRIHGGSASVFNAPGGGLIVSLALPLSARDTTEATTTIG